MEETSENKPMKHICTGIVAHVDAGKTTLAESILYLTGTIRKMGRVDHKDVFLDTYAMEKARGITIFSKQAEFMLGDTPMTLLDTPGHVDFSAEMERTLQVLDYAILVISGAEGVQGHVETLWQLLSRYRIPVFLFINKMDQSGADREQILEELKRRLDFRCVDFSTRLGVSFGMFQGSRISKEEANAQWEEEVATCSEELLEAYLEGNPITDTAAAELIRNRQVFPCFFGSALKLYGVREFLEGLALYMVPPSYLDAFGARVYKISRDAQGTRLTHVKITGGKLRVKTALSELRFQGGSSDSAAAEEKKDEKVDQIRIYSGANYRTVEEVSAGMICAVTGLTGTRSGDGWGMEQEKTVPVLEPVLTYRVQLPDGADINGAYRKWKQLEEEEPELHILWDDTLRELHVQVMGDVQIEILKNMIRERYGLEVQFAAGSIVYKETIAGPVEGIGHFEPLRHYAEVHLLMEPGDPGSGLQFESRCSEDVLDRNWQRLIMTHLEEKIHRGVLTGAEITDMKVSLIAGKAHPKHTEGGDFRQATYRAVRNGLMKARSILLEPVYRFRLEVPADAVGRAMSDLQRMNGTFSSPEMEGDMCVLMGSVPVACLQNYSREVAAYTRGRGHLSCTLQGYEPCHNGDQVMAERQYYPEADVANTPDSVFCSHGAGFVVPWDLVESYAHLDSGLKGKVEDNTRLISGGDGWYRPIRIDRDLEGDLPREDQVSEKISEKKTGRKGQNGNTDSAYAAMSREDRELAVIFERTYGPVKRRQAFEAAPGIADQKDRPEASGVDHSQGQKSTQAYQQSLGQNQETAERQRQDFGQSQEAAENRQLQRNREITEKNRSVRKPANKEEYLLVDGYNIIFAWKELKELAGTSLEAARQRLMDILSNYQGFRKMNLILVFDAYKVKGNIREISRYHNIYVVFTREAETADQYIEKTVHEIGKKHHVTVATSDGLEQVIILGEGAGRMSAQELWDEVRQTEQEIRRDYIKADPGGKNLLIHQASEEIAEWMQEVRTGRKDASGNQKNEQTLE